MDKQEAFAELLHVDPQQAAWLRAIAAAFGKPTAITLRFEADAYTQGVFEQQPRPEPAPRKPRRRRG